MATISDRHDNQLNALVGASYPGASFTTFLNAVKAKLDGNAAIQQFKYQGDYSTAHVASALIQVRGA